MDFPAFRNIISQTTRDMQPRIPAPSHRHGTPSGPWPFLDLDNEIDPEQLARSEPPVPVRICDHNNADTCKGCWSGYPQSLFPNWTAAQQKRSRILKIIERPSDTCTIHYVDVAKDGSFSGAADGHVVADANKDTHWELMRPALPTNTRLRALFVEHLSGPVLQMLGTRYKIEPFFFSSSLGWIPSRYQEAIQPTKGDHITVILTFIRTIQNPSTVPPSPSSSYAASVTSQLERRPQDQVIDTQTPLSLRSSDCILLPDLLALHMVRSKSGNTIISYHAGHEYRTTAAKTLHGRLSAAGRSVYWNKIFSSHTDPTFVFLCLLWYALYAWDEAFEVLYGHISWLESRVIQTNDMNLTQELHVVRAHLLHYASLLEDFRKSVVFVLETPNPTLEDPALYSAEDRRESQELMERECGNLLSEINRLEKSRVMQGKRLKNVMNLGFSSVNIGDSKHMQKLTEAAVNDSAAMKQISYLTMLFLPSSLIAAVFGMNVEEINPDSFGTLAQFFEFAIPLTLITIWVIVAFQYHPKRNNSSGYSGLDRIEMEESSMWRMWERVGWPVMLVYGLFEKRKARREKLDIVI